MESKVAASSGVAILIDIAIGGLSLKPNHRGTHALWNIVSGVAERLR